MRRSIIAVTAATAIAAGGAVAVPALASTGSSAPSSATTSTGLTATQRAELDQFLSTHPKVAQALGARLDAWAAFAKAHPAAVGELQKVAGLSKSDRRAELKSWAKAHPADAKAWHEFRKQVRQERKERRSTP